MSAVTNKPFTEHRPLMVGERDGRAATQEITLSVAQRALQVLKEHKGGIAIGAATLSIITGGALLGVGIGSNNDALVITACVLIIIPCIPFCVLLGLNSSGSALGN